jgi:hypothetical protein
MNHRSANAYRPPVRRTTDTKRPPPVQSNSRLDFLKEPKTTCIPKQTPLPLNSRMIPLIATPTKKEEPIVKKGFVAMPSPIQWEQGFRPAWMLNLPRDPPEDYSDAQKMYLEYKKTGLLVYPKYMKGKKKVDKAASIAASFMKKNGKGKGKKSK